MIRSNGLAMAAPTPPLTKAEANFTAGVVVVEALVPLLLLLIHRKIKKNQVKIDGKC